MKTKLLLIGFSMSALISACSGGSSDQNLTQASTSRAPTDKASGEQSGNFLSPITDAELRRIQDFVDHSNLPMEAKSKLISAYISMLANQYQLHREDAVAAVSTYYGISKDGLQEDFYSTHNMAKFSSVVARLRSEIAAENGIGIPVSDAYNFKLVSDSKAIDLLRTDNLRQSLFSTKGLRDEQLRQGEIIFKAIDAEAQKSADAIISTLPGASEQSPKTLGSLNEIIKDAEQTNALRAAARIADEVGSKSGASDEQKKAMMPYFANSILKYGLTAKISKSGDTTSLPLNVSASQVSWNAGRLAKACGALNRFAKNRSSKLAKISEELTNFSKNGNVKLDLSKFINLDDVKKLQNKAANIDTKVKEYAEDVQDLVEIAAKLGVDPKVIAAANKGIQIAQTGEKALAAFISPTPSNIISAVGSIFGGTLGIGGPSAEAVMNQKLDTIISMEALELQDLADIKQSVQEIQREIAQTQSLIGDLSRQVASSSQALYKELINIEDGVQQLAKMEQRQERELTGATDCATLSSAISRGSQDDKSSAVRFQLRKELFSSRISPYLEGCYKFVALINPQTDASKQFLDTTEMGSDNAAGKIYVNIIQLLNGPTTPNLSILASNPLTNIFDASKALAAKSTDVLKSNMAADATLQMLRTEFAGKDELLDSLLVSQYADLVTKVSPLVSLYERYKESTDDSGSSNIEVLERMMQSDSSYREWLGNLMQIVNINIAQQSLLSGLSVIGSGQFNVQALSPADDSKIDCSKTVDSLFCLLNSDQQVRSNVLKFSLYRDLKNKTLGTISYNYVTTLPRSSDQDLDVIIASLKSSLASSWNFTKGKMPDGSSWIIAHFAKQSEPIPSAEEMNHGLIKYSPELNFLLATRENLLDLMTETRLNELSDRSAKNRIFREILRHAM